MWIRQTGTTLTNHFYEETPMIEIATAAFVLALVVTHFVFVAATITRS